MTDNLLPTADPWQRSMDTSDTASLDLSFVALTPTSRPALHYETALLHPTGAQHETCRATELSVTVSNSLTIEVGAGDGPELSPAKRCRGHQFS